MLYDSVRNIHTYLTIYVEIKENIIVQVTNNIIIIMNINYKCLILNDTRGRSDNNGRHPVGMTVVMCCHEFVVEDLVTFLFPTEVNTRTQWREQNRPRERVPAGKPHANS